MLDQLIPPTTTPGHPMARAPDISDLNTKQLRDLITKAELRLQEIEQEELQSTREKLQAMIEESGFDMTRLFPQLQKAGGGRGRPKAAEGTRTPARAKYKLGDGSTWSGRGRIPLILREQLKGTAGWDEETGNFESSEAREEGLKSFLL